MNVNNIINYIKQGVTIKTSNGHILFSLGISIITIIGLIVGAIAGSVSLHIAYVMLAIHMLSTVLSIALSSDFSFTRNLISLTINFVNLMVQMTLLLTMAYILVFGGNIFVIFIYLPIVLIPVIIGIYKSKRLKSGLYPNSKKEGKNVTLSFGAIMAVSGLTNILINGMEQKTLHILVFVLLLFLCCLFSVSLLIVQRVYYFVKYKKQGLITEEMMEDENC